MHFVCAFIIVCNMLLVGIFVRVLHGIFMIFIRTVLPLFTASPEHGFSVRVRLQSPYQQLQLGGRPVTVDVTSGKSKE